MDTIWEVIGGILLVARFGLILGILVWSSVKLRSTPPELLQLRFFENLKQVSWSMLVMSLGIVTGIAGVMPVQLGLALPNWWVVVFAVPSTIFMTWGVVIVYQVLSVPGTRALRRATEPG